MEISLILDIILVVLLSITISFAVLLNKRLNLLRRDKAILEKMALNFHASTERADQSVKNLKAGAESLKSTIRKAETLRDDLAFLSERGSAAADRLESVIRESRIENEFVTATVSKNSQNLVVENERSSSPDDAVTIKNGNFLSNNQSVSIKNSHEKSNEKISEAEKELLKALRAAN